MGKLFKKVTFLVLAVFVILFGISFFADGYTDTSYIRFTTPKQKNFILGTSRAAQGLQPDVFKNVLGIDIYNYSFTVTQSPYGKVYFESLLNKHNKIKGGVFILTVDPWSISSLSDNPDDLNQFRENDLCLGNTRNNDSSPNFEYLYKNLKGRYIDIVFPLSKISKNTFLHKNGWLEIRRIPMDSISVNKRTLDKIESYKTNALPKYKLSQVRIDYLLKTVKYFKNYGDVYIVRLPLDSGMMKIENQLMSNFDEVINEVIMLSDGYLDFTPHNNNYQYTDANHLYKDSGKIVSREIAEWIKGLQ